MGSVYRCRDVAATFPVKLRPIVCRNDVDGDESNNSIGLDIKSDLMTSYTIYVVLNSHYVERIFVANVQCRSIIFANSEFESFLGFFAFSYGQVPRVTYYGGYVDYVIAPTKAVA
jgi:hypothetical protein